MFGCGMYKVEWFNKAGEIVKSYDKYLTELLYRKEIMNIQIAFLQGMDVEGLRIKPLQD